MPTEQTSRRAMKGHRETMEPAVLHTGQDLKPSLGLLFYSFSFCSRVFASMFSEFLGVPFHMYTYNIYLFMCIYIYIYTDSTVYRCSF